MYPFYRLSSYQKVITKYSEIVSCNAGDKDERWAIKGVSIW